LRAHDDLRRSILPKNRPVGYARDRRRGHAAAIDETPALPTGGLLTRLARSVEQTAPGLLGGIRRH
jgi:hypothetical protein